MMTDRTFPDEMLMRFADGDLDADEMAVIETAILEQITPEHVAYMRTRIPMNRFGRVEEAAALVTWLASRECSFSTGAVYDLSGGRATY